MVDLNNNGIPDDQELPIQKGESEAVHVEVSTKVGFFEAKPGEMSSTRLILILGAIIAFALSTVAFGFGLFFMLTGGADIIGALASLVGVTVGPIFTFIGTLKLVQNGQEKEQ